MLKFKPGDRVRHKVTDQTGVVVGPDDKLQHFTLAICDSVRVRYDSEHDSVWLTPARKLELDWAAEKDIPK